MKSRLFLKIASLNICLTFVGILPFGLPLGLFLLGVTSATSQDPNASSRINPSFLDPISVVRHLYKAIPMRNILQYDSSCFQQHPYLVYEPKPATSCIQSNLEYKVAITFGRFGDRVSVSSEQSAPSLIVLGDSHALGWGVADDQTFTHILSSNGIHTLNLAVSSYGTVRELQRLRDYARTNSSAYAQVGTILVVYNPNDIGENKSFLALDDSYHGTISASIAEYSSLSRRSNPFYYERGKTPLSYISNPATSFKIITTYWSFVLSYLQQYSAKLLSKFESRPSQSPPSLLAVAYPERNHTSSHGSLFFSTLEKNRDLFLGKKIIVVISDDWGHENVNLSEEFVSECTEICKITALYVLPPVSSGLIPDVGSYYLVDDHLSPTGHSRLAQALLSRFQADRL
jgi:hypothetical protein